MKLTVMTYNIYSGRTLEGAYDLSGKIETIRALQPDLLGLNEVHQNTSHSGFTAQTDTIADALELPYRFFARAIDHDGGQYGIALLSRYPLLTCFRDCAAPLPPEQRFTFRSDRPYERIDYIFASDAFTVEDCRVPVSTASDHRPVAARLSLHD